MNTLSDADEGRAKPSVWPVYLAAAVILIVGMMYVLQCLLLIATEQPDYKALLNIIFLAGTAFGVFGVITSIGMFQLQWWGWVCGVIFAGVWGFQRWMALSGMLEAASLVGLEFPHSALVFAQVSIVAAVLLIVILATRRRLFFAPKQAGEE